MRGMASPGLAAAARRHAARVARRTGAPADSGCACDGAAFPARAPLRLSSTAEISTTCAPPALAHQRAHASAGHLRLFGRRHSVCGLAMRNPVAFAGTLAPDSQHARRRQRRFHSRFHSRTMLIISLVACVRDTYTYTYGDRAPNEPRYCNEKV